MLEDTENLLTFIFGAEHHTHSDIHYGGEPANCHSHNNNGIPISSIDNVVSDVHKRIVVSDGIHHIPINKVGKHSGYKGTLDMLHNPIAVVNVLYEGAISDLAGVLCHPAAKNDGSKPD